MAKKLVFNFGYQVNDVTPLSHYYEEILAYIRQLKTLGIRGDRNYLFYSKNGFGTAYYEETESELSAKDTFKYFSDFKNRTKFFNDVDKLLAETAKKIAGLDKISLKQIEEEQLHGLFLELMEIDGWIFTYFLVTQPHRTKIFEDEVRNELKKKVAASRVDAYFTSLALSEKPTEISKEQNDWLTLILDQREKLSPKELKAKTLAGDHPELYEKIKNHFKKYKTLSLGDGNWWPSIDYFIKNLANDYCKPKAELAKRLDELKHFEKTTLKRRQQLISELELSKNTVETIEFLANIGHYRFNLRTQGFIPVIDCFLPVIREIERRLQINDDALRYIRSDEELRAFFKDPSPGKISELRSRLSANKEYLLAVLDGEYRCFYGSEAAKMHKQLIKPTDKTAGSELHGNVAMPGKITATATVFQWGDDMDEKLKQIKKHPILIAGHTRPAMMPLIREAAGIITDEGGITSHAAIVSRELGLPSVINTKHATEVFKTGDKVELDAENGIVRKIQ